MRNVRAIALRELRAYFDAPVAYIVVVTFLAVTGWLFFSQLFLVDRATARVLFAPSPFSPSLLIVVLAPAITMRLIAEERKSGTIELLTTMPLTDTHVVLGKFLAALGLISVALALTIAYPLSVSFVGTLDWGPVVAGYVGLLLLSASLIAIGLFCSSLTDNQIVAFIASFLVSAALYYIYWLQILAPSSWAPLLEYVSVSYHLDNMARGVIDSRDVLYYSSVTVGALLLAIQSVSRQHA